MTDVGRMRMGELVGTEVPDRARAADRAGAAVPGRPALVRVLEVCEEASGFDMGQRFKGIARPVRVLEARGT
jgi:hypothetical protein